MESNVVLWYRAKYYTKDLYDQRILVFLSYLGDSTCFRFILQSSEQQSGNSDELDSELKSVVHQMTSIISHKRSNSSALSAVIEVTVETIVVNSAEKSGKHIGR